MAAASVKSDREKTGHLVLDAGAFISGCRVWEYAAKLYAVHEIKKEVRDLKARQLLDSGIFELELLEPSTEAFRRVVAFARATGDYAALSAVDLKVLALTLQLEMEQNGERFIRDVPQRPVFSADAPKLHCSLPKAQAKGKGKGKHQNKGRGKGKGKGKGDGAEQGKKECESVKENAQVSDIAKESETERNDAEAQTTPEIETVAKTETETETEDTTETVAETVTEQETEMDASSASDQTQTLESKVSEAENAEREAKDTEATATVAAADAAEDEDEDSEDEGEWVTPDNFAAVVLGHASDIEAVSDEELQRTHVACLTTDFAMQNVLLQMGLRVTSVDGLRIRRTKTWILRCIACFKVVQDRERLFCPHCGHDSLRKISVSVNEDGTVQYYNSKKQVNIRGTRYSLPKPKPGRAYQASQPILCEDQLLKRGNRRKKERKVDPFDPEFVFASKKRNQQAGVGVGRRGNPNETRRRGKKK